MSNDTYELFDKTLMDTKYKSATEVVNHVMSIASERDFIDLEDEAWMLRIADKQFKYGRPILLFEEGE